MDNPFSSISEGFDKKLSLNLSKQIAKDYNRDYTSMDTVNKSYHWTERTFTNDRGTTYRKKVREADTKETPSANGTNFFETPLGKLVSAVKVTEGIKNGVYSGAKASFMLSKIKHNVEELSNNTELSEKEQGMLTKVKSNLRTIYEPVVTPNIKNLENAIAILEKKVEGRSYFTSVNLNGAETQAYALIRNLPDYVLSKEQKSKVDSLKERLQKVQDTSAKNKELWDAFYDSWKNVYHTQQSITEKEIKPKMKELLLDANLEYENSVTYIKDFIEATKPTTPSYLKPLIDALKQKDIKESITNVANLDRAMRRGETENFLGLNDYFYNHKDGYSKDTLPKFEENMINHVRGNADKLLSDIDKVKLVSDETNKLGKEWFNLAKNYSEAKKTLKKINSGKRVTQSETIYDDYAEAGSGQWKQTRTVNVTQEMAEANLAKTKQAILNHLSNL